MPQSSPKPRQSRSPQEKKTPPYSREGILAARAARKPSVWATTHRIINRQPFTIIPPLLDIYDCKDPRAVVRKAAQVYISELLINLGLWTADTAAGGRGNALYVFPQASQLNDFSKARMDTAINLSPYIRGRTAIPLNVGLKHIGPGHLYLRGASSRSQIISVDADVLLCDEVAEYDAGTIDTLERRLSSSLLGWVRAGSTPRYPADEAGLLWDRSDQRVYEIRCSRCDTWQHLEIQSNLNVETEQVECRSCHKDLGNDRFGTGRWVAAQPQNTEWIGFHVSKLLSPRANLAELCRKYRAVLEGRATVSATQELYNSDFGEPYLPEGGHISPQQLDACCDPEYTELPTEAKGTIMGVDVGSRLHVVILSRQGDGYRLVYADSMRWGETGMRELDPILAKYGVGRCIVDANPETHAAQAFADRHKGRVWLAYYPNFGEGTQVDLSAFDNLKRTVKINRTIALDTTQQLVANQELILPQLVVSRKLGGAVGGSGYGEFYRHLGAPIRVLAEDAKGNPVARYEQNGADHFAHAFVYARIAAEAAKPVPSIGPRGVTKKSQWRGR